MMIVANRSDFYKAKLPRHIKRMLALMSTGDTAHDTDCKNLFIAAHARHVKFKLKRNFSDDSDGAGEPDDIVIKTVAIKDKKSGVVLDIVK